jgi:hypothetical protein
MTHHGQLYLRDNIPPRSTAFDKGKFGRLFPTLPPFASDNPTVRKNLLELGKPGGIMDANDPQPPTDPLTPNPNNPDNPTMTAGMTFLGQFLDHDITHDGTSSLERQVDPEAIENFRTPVFELDSLYGSGRGVSPHLYDATSPGTNKFLIDKAAPNDLPRNSQNIAIIGDPRNDENLIVSQLHLAFLTFHNAIVDHLTAGGTTNPNEVFDEAQRLVRWHYQWIIMHEFLPATVGQKLIDDILKKGRKFYNWRNEPFIPVEFSVAAYRFGHSQIRPGYIANFAGDKGKEFRVHIFNAKLDHSVDDPDDLSGGKRAPRRFIDWPTFFDLGDGRSKPNKMIDTKLSSPLFELPFISPNLPNNPPSLASRNLLRHLTFALPAGQRVAQAMQIKPLAPSDLADVKELDFDTRTPLWFYILREAAVREGGKRLGPVGGRIVAEVFLGILNGDRMSYLRQDPDWTPTLGKNHEFKMADLLRFAGVAPKP